MRSSSVGSVNVSWRWALKAAAHQSQKRPPSGPPASPPASSRPPRVVAEERPVRQLFGEHQPHLHAGRAHADVERARAGLQAGQGFHVGEHHCRAQGRGVGHVDAIERPGGARAAVAARHHQRLQGRLRPTDVGAVDQHAGHVAEHGPGVGGTGDEEGRAALGRGGLRPGVGRSQKSEEEHQRAVKEGPRRHRP